MAVPLKFKYVELPDSFTVNQLKEHLDTTEQTLCIAGSLDENFGKRLILAVGGTEKTKIPRHRNGHAYLGWIWLYKT